ncbi:diguanylate cyclase/phosphodiesterase with PAS/PAC sensor(s) [[Bacillus] selenitireducens MLS10]|uniref:Diguanylate cyclase/phosphodiesterase with PAS/PAC sensor(S) n=2 Tax=Salisediminibacterium selenitireducens TaxID=85683 RepID=D6XXX4_BACIE|nr:diguanylate cyclase/phosphodiesterase with PAS/PAC sensor(s) [[Bacillus] selenitireducens MLS10]
MKHIDISTALNANPDHAAIISLEGEILLTNLSWQAFSRDNTGDPDYTDVGVNYLDVLKKAGVTAVYEGIVSVLEGRQDFYHNKYPCHSPDENRWFIMTVTPLNEGGDIQGALIVHRNITEVEWAKNQTVDILESMTDAFFAVDQNWRFTFLNQEAEKLLQVSRSGLIGQNIWTVFPDALGTTIQFHYETVVDMKLAKQFETYFEPLDKWFEVHAYPRHQGGLAVFFKDISEKKASEQQIWEMANLDELTGLANRRFIYEKMNGIIQKRIPFSLFFMDLNDFKDINDVYGHDAGDQVLQKIGERLQALQEESGGVAARLGGDEFVFMIAELDHEVTGHFAERLLNLIRKRMSVSGYYAFSMVGSIGIAMYPETGMNVNEIMSAADAAMYEAKKSKSVTGTYRFYEISMREVIKRRIVMGDDMLTAIDRGDFYYVYQPQINMKTGLVDGVEVLSRWKHPQLGMIPPPEFIELAEETGKIRPLTERTIRDVLKTVDGWRRDWGYDGRVAFNVSSSLIESPSFFTFIKEQMTYFKIGRDQLELEITETVNLAASEALAYHLDQFRHIGVSLAIDDFGTGFSKISHLSRLPVDRIKVDRTFINEIGSGSKGEAILYAVIDLMNQLEVDVVAEGVEEEEQVRVLMGRNCSHIQGYYYARPTEEEEAVSYIWSFVQTKNSER